MHAGSAEVNTSFAIISNRAGIYIRLLAGPLLGLKSDL